MTGPDHRAEADAGVIFGEDGCSVLDPDGRVIMLRPPRLLLILCIEHGELQ